MVRANVVSQWDEDYVRAERVIGGSRTYILLKHVVRNTAAPVLVFATVMVADAIVFEDVYKRQVLPVLKISFPCLPMKKSGKVRSEIP